MLSPCYFLDPHPSLEHKRHQTKEYKKANTLNSYYRYQRMNSNYPFPLSDYGLSAFHLFETDIENPS